MQPDPTPPACDTQRLPNGMYLVIDGDTGAWLLADEVEQGRSSLAAIGNIPLITKHAGRLPGYIVFNTTDGCNLRCRYCYKQDTVFRADSAVFPGREVQRDLVRYCERLAALGLEPSVEFHGGEPLLQADQLFSLADDITEATAGRTGFSLVTNGTLLTAELARRIAARKISGNRSARALD